MPNTLLLVDGSSYLYRAFHALPNMRNAAGEPTGALYGMINMLRKLLTDTPAAYLACVFDAKGKTFRDAIYPDYKATRSAMPDDLRAQIAPIHAAVAAMGWPILCIEGVEADDVIGTLSVNATTLGLKTVISTGDKDMAQLVNDHVTLINTMTDETLDVAGVIHKFGVPPGRIVDYLTLIGDTVDHIPGVPKVGPKTAVKWLVQYGSVEAVMAHAAEMGGAVGENLRQTLEWLPTAKTLVTIKTDCDLSTQMTSITASLAARQPEVSTLTALYTRYNFKTWLKELSGVGKQAHNQHNDQQYECVLTQAQLTDWLEKITHADLTAFDTETTSLDPMQAQLVGIALSCEPGKAAYIPVAHTLEEKPTSMLSREYVLTTLRPWLEDPKYAKVGQNMKYDAHVLANHGITLRGIVHDTLLESYVSESHRTHGMDSLALRHLNYQTIPFDAVCGKGAAQITFDRVPLDAATAYAAEDADITRQLHQAMWPSIRDSDKLRYVYETIEIPTAVVLQKIERKGVLIDTAKLTAQSETLGQRLSELEAQATTLVGRTFNLNSPKQISVILFEEFKLPIVKKTASGAPSTDEEVLQKLAQDYPLPKLLLEHRSLSKLKSTYTDTLPQMVNPMTGRVHTNYAQTVAVTGRLASNDPNLQNIPIRTAEGRKVREAFIAAPGHVIVSADYSQIELRIMAHLSGDENMLRAFAEGHDIHRATAAEIFNCPQSDVTTEQRRYAKVINFGLIYGMSAFGLASNLGIERAAAQHYIDQYFVRFAGVKRYMEDTRLQAKAQGYVETVFGRRLWLPEINAANGARRAAAERAAINAPMQGTAADLIKLSMIAVQAWLETKQLTSAIIMQVHDELVLEVLEAEYPLVCKQLPKLMAGVACLKVPLVAEVGVGGNWDEAH